jgi:hypothetical protein
MKLLVILFLLFSFSCQAQNKEPNSLEVQNKELTKMLLSYKSKLNDVEFEYNVKFIKRNTKEGDIYFDEDSLQIEYKLVNAGKKNYLIFNQGHNNESFYGHNSNYKKMYVEPQKDGIIEISQKRFFEPKDKNCPERDELIIPKAVWLKSKQTITQTLIVPLPLQVKTPFDDCVPKAEMPKQIKGLKFCLGIAEANAKKVKVADNGSVTGWEHTKPQILLCSDIFNFN